MSQQEEAKLQHIIKTNEGVSKWGGGKGNDICPLHYR